MGEIGIDPAVEVDRGGGGEWLKCLSFGRLLLSLRQFNVAFPFGWSDSDDRRVTGFHGFTGRLEKGRIGGVLVLGWKFEE